MTEAEWLVSDDIEPMIEVLIERRYPDAEPCNWKAGERKKLLFVSECLHRVGHLLPAEFRTLAEMIRKYADGTIRAVGDYWEAADSVRGEHANLLSSLGYDDLGLFCSYASELSAGTNDTERRDERRRHAAILREIFGNPFRTVALELSWRSSTILALSRQMYESRDFSLMPVLSDALQDAGCENDDVLSHCRSEGPHVRGCWAVDLILGKE